MTSTRATGRPQSLKITAREALREARARREEWKPAQAAAVLDRAAQARETLIADYLTPALERELASATTEGPRRRALAAHLLNSQKAKPRREP
jgi:hypothetical protein